jgi:hypothetical protein
MAFGKDARTLNAVSAFGSLRQQTAAATKQAGKRASRGGPPYFVDMYQPSMMDIDTIRLVPGEYLQDYIEGEGDNAQLVQKLATFVKFVDHFDGHMQRGAICSAGAWANDRNKRSPCYGCDIYWETAARNTEGRFTSTRISRQNKYAFCVFDYARYHKMEQIDRSNGQVRRDNKGQPFYNWVKCQGQGCDACRAPNIETKQGNMSHWPMNYTQLQVLRAAETNIGKSCTTCGSVNSINSMAWLCSNCKECAIDMATTHLKKDELLQITDNLCQCASCGQQVLLTEVYECSVCAQRGQQGVRATLFDVDLQVQLIPMPNDQKNLQISGWSQPYPIPAQFAEAAKPLDLVAKYKPDSLEYQASRFGIKVNAPAPGATAPQRQPQTGPQQGYQQPPMQQAPQGYAPQPQQGYTPPQYQPPMQQAPARPYQVPYGNKPAGQ